MISRFDTLKNDGFRLKYDWIREKYHITIDSVLKRSSSANDLPETVMTPDFSVNLQEYRIFENVFTGLDEKGDSVFVNQVEFKGNVSGDDTWFRIGEKKHIVILRNVGDGFVIDYSQVCGGHILQLLRDIEQYGEKFFSLVH